MGEFHKAMDSYNMVLEIDPSNADAKQNLEHVMMKIQEANQSGEAPRAPEARDGGPGDPGHLRRPADALDSAGDADRPEEGERGDAGPGHQCQAAKAHCCRRAASAMSTAAWRCSHEETFNTRARAVAQGPRTG